MKERRLKNDGVEGDADDDWQLVNCKTFLVHVMLPSTYDMSNQQRFMFVPPQTPCIDDGADMRTPRC
jgi:hypothetical protein